MASFEDVDYAMLFVNRSRIGKLVPDITIEEVYDDRVQITSHPVEKGSNISDHAYMLPKQLDMRVGWADHKGGNEQWSLSRYEQLRKIQSELEPLTVITKKRMYENMMIVGISVTNDEKSPHSVIATVRMTEVRFAGVISNISSVPGHQAFPQTTQPPTDLGNVQPTKVASVPIPPPRPSDLGTAPPPPPRPNDPNAPPDATVNTLPESLPLL